MAITTMIIIMLPVRVAMMRIRPPIMSMGRIAAAAITTGTSITPIIIRSRRVPVVFDDFFVRAIVAGVGLALTTGPLGCFIIWRRMAYFGDTMAHSALLGVALSLLFELNLILSVFFVAALVSILLLLLQRRGALSADALLGILSHATLAIGLVMVAFMTWVRIDLVAFLFGDILAVTTADIQLIWGGGVLVLFAIVYLWRPLLASTVNPEIAEAEGLQPEKARLYFMLLMALVIAIAMKIVGIMLITSLLIIPAATARRFSSTPEIMAVLASLIGALAVVGGLFGSLHYDTPSGPSIVVAALLLFILSLLPLGRKIEAGAGHSHGGHH